MPGLSKHDLKDIEMINFFVKKNQVEIATFFMETVNHVAASDKEKAVYLFLDNYLKKNWIVIDENLKTEGRTAFIEIMKQMLNADVAPETYKPLLDAWKKEFKRFGLNKYDLRNNQIEINTLLLMELGHFPESGEEMAIADFLNDFLRRKKIAIDENLSNEEQAELAAIIHCMISTPVASIRIYEKDLDAWKNKLKKAVNGQGDHINMHAAQSSGMIADLLNRAGKIHADKMVTDLDLLQFLADVITSPEDIKTAKNTKNKGIYVLPPTTSNESAILKDLLLPIKKAIHDNKISGTINIIVPINCGNYHWNVGLFELNCVGGAIKEIRAALWDPMHGNDKDGERKIEFKAFNSAINTIKTAAAIASEKVETFFKFGKVQVGGLACGIHIAQHILKSIGANNKFTQAKDEKEARFEFVKSLLPKHPVTASVDVSKLQMNSVGEISLPRVHVVNNPLPLPADLPIEAVLKKAEDKTQSLTDDDKFWQIKFDRIYASNLQKLYEANVDDEKTAETKARESALREFGFFNVPSKASDVEETFKPRVKNTPRVG